MERKDKLMEELNTMYAILKNPHMHGINAFMGMEEINKGLVELEKKMTEVINERNRPAITRKP